jgi:hypothetical protein
VVADAAHDQGVIAIAQFRDEHADGEGPLFPERAREQAGLVVKFSRSGANAFAGLERPGTLLSTTETVAGQRPR